jgi:adenylosuccinate lyase
MSNDLHSFLFSTPEMTRVFSAQEQLRAMLRFEWALTSALEEEGLAEAGSGAVLNSFLDAAFADMNQLKREARDDGNIAISFVRQLSPRRARFTWERRARTCSTRPLCCRSVKALSC